MAKKQKKKPVKKKEEDKLSFYSFHLINRLQDAQKGKIDAREVVHHLQQTARAIKFYCFSKTKKGGK